MITEQGLRLATAEVTPNGGAAPGGIGNDSEALNLDPGGFTEVLRNFGEIGSGRPLCMAFNVDTTFTATNVSDPETIEFSLISLPIVSTLLTDATTSGKTLTTTGVVTDFDGGGGGADTFTLVGHGLPLGTPIHLTTISGTTGIATGTVYYVIPFAADTFKVATTLALAVAGTAVDLLTADGSVTVNYIPTVHASSGRLAIFDTPSDIGPLQAGRRFHVPIRPLEGPTAVPSLPAGQTLKVPLGAGPGADLAAANANRYYYLHYFPTATITAGAITCDIVLEGESGKNYYGSGFEVIG